VFLKHLEYPIIKEYPKGEKVDYNLGEFQKPIVYNRITKEYYQE